MMTNHSQSSSNSSEFPKGLRVLLVDCDPDDLNTMDQMFKQCQYNVTACLQPKKALDIIREMNGEFDIVLCDVYMPDMDGFELLENIKSEMNIPVIMMSVEDENDLVLKVFKYGALYHLTKPVSLEAVKTIWKHLVKRKSIELKDMDNSMSIEVSDKQKNPLENGDNTPFENEENWAIVKREREREEADGFEERESLCSVKKPRVVWTPELHTKFVEVVEQLGVEKAVPKKILELMSEPGLTRENVASHLQKYRIHLKKSNGPQHQGRTDVAFSTVGGAPFVNPINYCFDGYDLQALAGSAEGPPQALITVGPRMAATNYLDSRIASRVVFNSEAQLTNSSNTTRPTMVQQVNINQMNLLAAPMFQSHGNLSHQGLVSLPSSLRTSSSFPDGNSINDITVPNSFIMQRGRPVPFESNMGQLPNRVVSEHDSRFNYGHIPRPLHPNIQNNIPNESNCHPHVNSSAVTSAARVVEALDDITNFNGTKDAIPYCDDMLINRENKSQAWKLKNINLSYASSQHVGSKPINHIDYGSSLTGHQDLINGNLKDGAARDTYALRRERFSMRAEVEHEQQDHAPQDELINYDMFQLEEAVGQEPEINFESFYDPELSSICPKGVERELQLKNIDALSISK